VHVVPKGRGPAAKLPQETNPAMMARMPDHVDHWTAPIAYHLTFTTYGTWLHGDDRGSVDRKTHEYMVPDPARNEFIRERLKHPIVTLSPKARRIVREGIEGYCKFKSWPLLALNVRTNHVHLVVGASDTASKMLNGVKARATRLLRDECLFEESRPVWTERGNKGLLLTQEAVDLAVDYVLNRQGPPLPEE
jgi:REP element-mobilizing transposase RayT